MEELKIYKFQAESIKRTLNHIAQLFNCHEKITSLDRDVMQDLQTIENVLKKEIDKVVPRM